MGEFIHLSTHTNHQNRHVLLLLVPILIFITFVFLIFKRVDTTGQRSYSTQGTQAVLGEETQNK